jgi:hypothetical protein
LWGQQIGEGVVPDPGPNSIKDGCRRLSLPPGGVCRFLTLVKS